MIIQGLREVVMACLKKADQQRHRSISFPAIGTGGQKYPKDTVAKEMFACVSAFARSNPKSSVTTVRFVVYYKDNDVYQVCRVL